MTERRGPGPLGHAARRGAGACRRRKRVRRIDGVLLRDGEEPVMRMETIDTVNFTVSGDSYAELVEKARERLNAFAGSAWFELAVEPESSLPGDWRAEVTGYVVRSR